jgi:hypothetical protein
MASDVVSWHGRGHSRQSRGRGYNRSPTSGNSYRKFRATNYSRLCWPARALAEALIADPCSHSSIHRRRLTTSTAQRGRWRICIESLRSSPDSPSSFAASRSVAMTRQPSRAKATAVARPDTGSGRGDECSLPFVSESRNIIQFPKRSSFRPADFSREFSDSFGART